MEDIRSEIARAVARAEKAWAMMPEKSHGPDDRHVRKLMSQYGVPPLIADGLGKHRRTKCVDAVEQWRKSDSWCLVLSGPRGIGKSFAAAHWLWMLARDDSRKPHQKTLERWHLATEIAICSSYDGKLERLVGAGEMVVEDIGTEPIDAKGYFRSRFDWLVEKRVSYRRRLVLTCNLTPEDFRARYGERVWDRIRGGGVFREITEKSMRGKSE